MCDYGGTVCAVDKRSIAYYARDSGKVCAENCVSVCARVCPCVSVCVQRVCFCTFFFVLSCGSWVLYVLCAFACIAVICSFRVVFADDQPFLRSCTS